MVLRYQRTQGKATETWREPAKLHQPDIRIELVDLEL